MIPKGQSYLMSWFLTVPIILIEPQEEGWVWGVKHHFPITQRMRGKEHPMYFLPHSGIAKNFNFTNEFTACTYSAFSFTSFFSHMMPFLTLQS